MNHRVSYLMIAGSLLWLLSCSESSSTGQTDDVRVPDVSGVDPVEDGAIVGNDDGVQNGDDSVGDTVNDLWMTDTATDIPDNKTDEDAAVGDISGSDVDGPDDVTDPPTDVDVQLGDGGDGDGAGHGDDTVLPQFGKWTESFDDNVHMDPSATTATWGGGILTVDYAGTFGNGVLLDFFPETDQELSTDNGPLDFANIGIPAGVTVHITGSQPAIFRVTGAVNIEGKIVLNGTAGGAATPDQAGGGGIGGPGGGNGGDGAAGGAKAGQAATGPGAGSSGASHATLFGVGFGGGAGFTTAGQSPLTVDPWSGAGGKAYGSDDLLFTLTGGSGGGAGGAFDGSNITGPNTSDGWIGPGDRPGGGGGGGGGALMIIAKGPIVVSGVISAQGGSGGDGIFSPSGQCCAVGMGPGCDGTALEVCVCEINPDCCKKGWGPGCVDAAEECGSCLGTGGAGGGGSGGSIGLFSASTVELWGGSLDVQGGGGGKLIGDNATTAAAGSGSDGRVHVGAVSGVARWVQKAIPTPTIHIDNGAPIDPFETFSWTVEGTQTIDTGTGQLLVTKLVIPKDATLVATGPKPLDIVVSGNAVIDGVILLNGQSGGEGVSACCNSSDNAVGGLGGMGGPGGFSGGEGSGAGMGQDGLGTAGGKTSPMGKQISGGGGGGGHAAAGQQGGCPAGGAGGDAVAETTALDGGSGGGGASASNVMGYSGGGGGGGGGGSIRLLVGGTLQGSGVIYADGGEGGITVGKNGTFGSGGGGGAGGKIIVKSGKYDADLRYYARGGYGGFVEQEPDVCWIEGAAPPRSGGDGSVGVVGLWSQSPVGLIVGEDASALSSGYDPWLGTVAYTHWVDTFVESPEYIPSADVVLHDGSVSGNAKIEIQGRASLTSAETAWVDMSNADEMVNVHGNRYFRLRITLEPSVYDGPFGIAEVSVQWSY